jgi:hypothetical protein
MISAIFVFNHKGEILVNRLYREDIKCARTHLHAPTRTHPHTHPPTRPSTPSHRVSQGRTSIHTA